MRFEARSMTVYVRQLTNAAGLTLRPNGVPASSPLRVPLSCHGGVDIGSLTVGD